MKQLRRVRSPKNRWVLVVVPVPRGGRKPATIDFEVSFGDVMSEMPRSLRFPATLPQRLGRHGDGQQFITRGALENLVTFNKDDKRVMRQLEEFIEHIASEVQGEPER